MLISARNIFVINVIFLNRNVNKNEKNKTHFRRDYDTWRFNDETKQKSD